MKRQAFLSQGFIKLVVLSFTICSISMLGSCGKGGSSGNDDARPATAAEAITPVGALASPPPGTAEEMGKSIRDQLTSAHAYEIFGESVMNAYLAEVDKMLAMAYGRPVKSAATKSVKRVPTKGDCETYSGNYEKDGVVYEGSMTMCPQEDEDKFIMKFEFIAGLNGITTTSSQKGLRMEIGLDVETYKCPTSEGKLTGSSLIHYLMYVSDGKTSVHTSTDTQLDMDATVNDDAEVEKVDLKFNIGLTVDETGFPAVGYNGISTASGKNLDLKDATYTDQFWNNLNPDEQFYNANTVAKCAGMGIGMALGALDAVAESAEKNWKTDGKCVRVRITPEDLKMGSGEKKEVEVEVLMVKDESPVEAKLEALTDCGKTISPAAARYTPDAKAKFEYTTPDDGKEGCFTIKATSKAGKDSHEVYINYTRTIHIDSTVTLNSGNGIMTGTIKSVVPLAEKDGVLSGSAPINYVSFQFTIPGSECTFTTGALSSTDAKITSFTPSYDTPASTSMVLTPFFTTESYTALCPDAPPAPSGSHALFYSGNFFYLHNAEFSQNGWTMTGWEKGDKPGIPLVKRYERTTNIDGAALTETTVIELHTGPEQ